MVKKIIAVATAILMLCCMIPIVVFADDVLDVCPKCGERTYETWNDCSTSIPDIGLPVSVKRRHCTSCQYTYYDWNCMGFTGYKDFDSGSGSLLADYLKEWKDKTLGQNATAKKYETGGGSADGSSGVGRHPSGYTDTAGTPSISSAGVYTLTLNPIIEVTDNEHCTVTVTGNKVRIEDFDEDYIKSTTVYPIRVYYTATSPADGKFSVPYKPSQRVYDYYYGGGSGSNGNSISGTSNGSLYAILLKNGVDFSGGYTKLDFYGRASVFQGTQVWFAPVFSSSASPNGKFFYIGKSNVSYAYYHMTFYPLVVQFTPDQVSKKTNITINQNVWNGNIYQDNSTNLTYIYPQYTTINENNETVTNISENPIIYNNETNEYYTYDSTTNNYYYITYVTNPTPTPSPSPTPDPDTPDATPTPTPTPGGDTGDTTGILAVLVEIRDNMIQGFLDLKAMLVQGWADLSANFTLAIDNLNVNIQNIINKKFPDQSTPETAQPSPSPSPSPDPSPSPSPTPDPDSPDATPTPAPTDKPDSGDTTNNFWTIIFPDAGNESDGNHKGILWALVSLILALITFFVNMAAGYKYLFPFLPDGVVMTIHVCLFVLFLFVIIKFIMRSK